jgi:hypothetical protein
MSNAEVLKQFPDHTRPNIKLRLYGKVDWEPTTPELMALKQAHDAITNGSDVIHNNVRSILGDETVMPAARFLRGGDFAEKTAKTIEARVEDALAPARKRLGELQRQLEERLTPSVSPGHAIRDQEIRQHFAQLKGEEKMRRADEAMKAGDLVTVRALMTAPAYLTGLNEQTQKRLRGEYLARIAPEQMQLGATLEHALDVVDRAHAALIEKVAGELPWSDIEKIRASRLA